MPAARATSSSRAISARPVPCPRAASSRMTAARRLVEDDGMFCGVAIAGTGAERAERGQAQDPVRVLGHDERFAARGDVGGEAVLRFFLGGEGHRRVADERVPDREDRGDVRHRGGAQRHASTRRPWGVAISARKAGGPGSNTTRASVNSDSAARSACASGCATTRRSSRAPPRRG